MLGVDQEKLHTEREPREVRKLVRLQQQKCKVKKCAASSRQEQKTKGALLRYDMGSFLSTLPLLNNFASLF